MEMPYVIKLLLVFAWLGFTGSSMSAPNVWLRGDRERSLRASRVSEANGLEPIVMRRKH